jgi:hypothetical protein
MADSEHDLHEWSQYLTNNDYNYLIQFIENITPFLISNAVFILEK